VKTKIEKITQAFFPLISQHTQSHSLQEELEGYYFPPVGLSRLQCRAFLVLPVFLNIQPMDSELHMEFLCKCSTMIKFHYLQKLSKDSIIIVQPTTT
jgi:hypothetical protein